MKSHIEVSQESYNKTIQKQGGKGLEKYGQPMNPLDNYDWLSMAEEELVDGHQYLVAEKKKREFIAAKIRKLTNDDLIHFWLDQLEGK